MQSSALPLGYAASLERKTGFEPATFALARRCSTTEPLPQWCRRAELNCRHVDFQSTALPTELPRLAELTGVEPAISCVTGRHVRPLHHSSSTIYYTQGYLERQASGTPAKNPVSGVIFMVREVGLEPTRLSPHGPQPCLSANSSTLALTKTIIRRIKNPVNGA